MVYVCPLPGTERKTTSSPKSLPGIDLLTWKTPENGPVPLHFSGLEHFVPHRPMGIIVCTLDVLDRHYQCLALPHRLLHAGVKIGLIGRGSLSLLPLGWIFGAHAREWARYIMGLYRGEFVAITIPLSAHRFR
jgi:hypothetical protein